MNHLVYSSWDSSDSISKMPNAFCKQKNARSKSLPNQSGQDKYLQLTLDDKYMYVGTYLHICSYYVHGDGELFATRLLGPSSEREHDRNTVTAACECVCLDGDVVSVERLVLRSRVVARAVAAGLDRAPL